MNSATSCWGSEKALVHFGFALRLRICTMYSTVHVSPYRRTEWTASMRWSSRWDKVRELYVLIKLDILLARHIVVVFQRSSSRRDRVGSK
jgi:hypothetical protein